MRSSQCFCFRLVVGIVMATLATVGNAATYTFESLTSATALVGQDNWTNASNTPAGNPSVIEAGLGVNTSQLVRYQTSTQNSSHLQRQNNVDFAFPTYAGTETNAVFEFDLYYVTASNNETTFAVIQNGQQLAAGSNVSPFFGLSTSGGQRFSFRKARFGAITNANIGSAAVANDWLRLRMELDFTANAGQGSASVFYQNLTNGDAGFTPIAGLQNLNAGLTGGVSNWDTLYLRLDGTSTEKRADNLTVVPEPSGAILIVCGCIICAARRLSRVRRSQKG